MSCLECGRFDVNDFHLCAKCNDKYIKIGNQVEKKLKAQKERGEER